MDLETADYVVLAMPDMQGRLVGVRLDGSFYRDVVAESGYGMCGYLLQSDVDMVAFESYSGFGDVLVRPDPPTARRVPWQESTVLVIGDPQNVEVAPRQILRRQLDRLSRHGYVAMVGTELEFLLFAESYRESADAGYTGLRPVSRQNSDYSLLGSRPLDRVVAEIVRNMTAAGLPLESMRGECHPGQYEIVYRYADAMTTCDRHVFYKTGAKQIAENCGHALTFMAKYDEGEGNSCHVHLSLSTDDGSPAFSDDRLLHQFIAGQLACAADFALLFAPMINSYKRLQPGSFAPTVADWGIDDRTRAVRVAGAGAGVRIEHRIAGADANPYLVVAGIVAAGLYGIEHGLAVEEAAGPLPRTLAEALARWESSVIAENAFGSSVVDRVAEAARSELDTFNRSVTDWERRRGFERL